MVRLVPAVANIVLAASALACGMAGGSPPESQVLSAAPCPDERCVDASDAIGQIGWPFLEPSAVPDSFSLFSRLLLPHQSEAGGADAQPSFSVVHDYRFMDSFHVPGITMIQTKLPPGMTLALEQGANDCGELTTTPAGPAYYAEGPITVTPDGDAEALFVCLDASSARTSTHSIVLVSGGILVEILAFPESGISRDEVLTLAGSLRPVAN